MLIGNGCASVLKTHSFKLTRSSSENSKYKYLQKISFDKVFILISVIENNVYVRWYVF